MSFYLTSTQDSYFLVCISKSIKRELLVQDKELWIVSDILVIQSVYFLPIPLLSALVSLLPTTEQMPGKQQNFTSFSATPRNIVPAIRWEWLPWVWINGSVCVLCSWWTLSLPGIIFCKEKSIYFQLNRHSIILPKSNKVIIWLFAKLYSIERSYF